MPTETASALEFILRLQITARAREKRRSQGCSEFAGLFAVQRASGPALKASARHLALLERTRHHARKDTRHIPDRFQPAGPRSEFPEGPGTKYLREAPAAGALRVSRRCNPQTDLRCRKKRHCNRLLPYFS